MHIHKFEDIASLSEIGVGVNLPETEEYRELIKKLHPTQFLTGRLTAPLYEVEYSYVTVRGNYRKAYKYILLRFEHDDLDLEIEMIFSDWVEELNRKCPYRRILNAQILKIKPIAYATIPFEI